MKRHIYRPILVYRIEGVERALIGMGKLLESFMVIATNAIHWNKLPSEWLTVKSMRDFINKKGNEHDRILENKIEAIIKDKGLLFCRNIKSFRQHGSNNIRIDTPQVGEIDFIIVNPRIKKIFVCETKYNQSKNEAVGYRSDYSKFVDEYEPKLHRKTKWVSDNHIILQEHLKIVYDLAELDLSGYSVEAIFFINTPTFYMFNGSYKAITLHQVSDFIEGEYKYPSYLIEETQEIISHPYFRKPN